MLAHVANECGRERTRAAVMKIKARPWRRQRNATVKARRQEGGFGSVDASEAEISERDGLRGKKTRKSRSLGGR